MANRRLTPEQRAKKIVQEFAFNIYHYSDIDPEEDDEDLEEFFEMSVRDDSKGFITYAAYVLGLDPACRIFKESYNAVMQNAGAKLLGLKTGEPGHG